MKGRKVFILGSGFSASLGLPTLNNLFTEIMSFPDRRGERDKEQIYHALTVLYPHFNLPPKKWTLRRTNGSIAIQ